MKELICLKPIEKQLIWGTETWVVSGNQQGDCEIQNKGWKVKTLSELWHTDRKIFGGMKEQEFPLLVKMIDTKKDLSIQVHPNDQYAYANEHGKKGKNECWYILDCAKNASVILGHYAKSKQEFTQEVENGQWKTLLREVPVHPGDFIQIDAGTLHAIKGGIKLLEIQQNSTITYRLYDYDRLENGKKRELQTAKALEVVRVPAKPVEQCVKHKINQEKNSKYVLIQHPCYTIWRMELEKNCYIKQKEPFLILNVINGEGSIGDLKVGKGDHILVPQEYGIIGLKGRMELIGASCQMR